MKNDKDLLIENMKYNIREKQRYIEALQEYLFQLKGIIEKRGYSVKELGKEVDK